MCRVPAQPCVCDSSGFSLKLALLRLLCQFLRIIILCVLYACAHIHMCMSVHVCTPVCGWRPEFDTQCLPHPLSTSFSEKRTLTKSGCSSWILQDELPRMPQGSSHLCLPSPVIINAHYVSFLHGVGWTSSPHACTGKALLAEKLLRVQDILFVCRIKILGLKLDY